MSFSAVVLAGTRPGGDPLSGHEGVPHKALIDVGGEPMLARVIAALREAGAARIGVSCSDAAVAALARDHGAEVLPASSGPSDSAAQAFAQFGAPMVITTADHALLLAEWVRQLLDDTPVSADLSIMFAARDRVEAALPGSKRTWLRFADNQWSGCNLFFLATPIAKRALDLWAGIEANRKRPWRIVARLGPRAILGYALGRLTLAGGLATLGRRHGMAVAVVAAADGLAAVDVDKPSDLADVRRIVAARMEG